MTALISVFVTITVSLLVTRLAAEAIVLTGLSRQAAEFQARSAFTGAGFTTQESEQITNHPARRKIVMLLMLFGNAGVISVISSLVLTFIGAPNGKTRIYAGDLLIIYGREDALSQLDSRCSGSIGDQDHRQAVAEQQQVENEESMLDKASRA